MIVTDDSSVINKLQNSLTDDARVIIYDCHMFIVQATGVDLMKLFWCKFTYSFLQARHLNSNAINIAYVYIMI